MTNNKEIRCESVLGNTEVLRSRFWTRYSFDPYVNCGLNCVYCDSSSTKFSGSSPSPIYVKINAPKVLSKELLGLKRKGVLRMGIWSDPYQPIEKKYQLTKQILEVLNENDFPFAIGTKSDLVLRDIKLISEISEKTHCVVALSLSGLDEELARLVEPDAPPPRKRLEVIRKLSDVGVTTGVWLAPIFPYLTDSQEEMGRIIEAVVENGAKFVLGAVFDMRNPHQFKGFLKNYFPHLSPKYEKMYLNDKPCHYPDDEYYLYNLAKKFIFQCQKYEVEMFLPHFSTLKQAWLFYLQNFFKFKGAPFFGLNQLLNYFSPYQDILQTFQINFGKKAFGKTLLKIFHYFPH